MFLVAVYMKKHNMLLSYKELHAIKHALEKTLYYREDYIKQIDFEVDCFPEIIRTKEQVGVYNQTKKDIEYETNLLERITERINQIKDKYKIGE